MRRVRYSVAASLDGFIAGPNGEFDWIPMDPTIDFAAFYSTIDTVLMGRGTYEIVQMQKEQGEAPPDASPRSYVFSRTLKSEDHPDVTVVSDDAAGVVAGLREEEGKDIWLMGGGILFRSLLDAGLVDTVEVGIVPILLGSGIPLLPPGETRGHLEHVKSETFPSGIILVKYRVV
jgi:dihydrofolate reductase